MNRIAAVLLAALTAALCPLSFGPAPTAGTSFATSPLGMDRQPPVRRSAADKCQFPQDGIGDDGAPPDELDRCGPDGSCESGDDPIEI